MRDQSKGIKAHALSPTNVVWDGKARWAMGMPTVDWAKRVHGRSARSRLATRFSSLPGETPPPWIVYRSLDFGIGLFEATRESLAYKFVQGDGTVLDSATFPVRETGMHSRTKLHRRRAARVVQDDDDDKE